MIKDTRMTNQPAAPASTGLATTTPASTGLATTTPAPTRVGLLRLENYPLLAQPVHEALTLIAENMGADFRASDLPRIKTPGAGGKVFEIPRADGDRSERAFECIMIYKRKTVNKVRWAAATPSHDPPTCSSDDGKFGVGNPGGQCSSCPHDKFGSAINEKGEAGRGKSCKDLHVIFPLLEGDSLPYALTLPPTSIAALKRYCGLLIQSRIPYYAVMTRIGLATARSKTGIDYSTVTFDAAKSPDGKPIFLANEHREQVRALVYGDGRENFGLSRFLEAIRPTVSENDEPATVTP